VYDFLFRKYDPSAGRWLSPDPLGWGAVNTADPQSLDRYAYVENQPMNLTDPNGEDYMLCVSAGTTCYIYTDSEWNAILNGNNPGIGIDGFGNISGNGLPTGATVSWVPPQGSYSVIPSLNANSPNTPSGGGGAPNKPKMSSIPKPLPEICDPYGNCIPDIPEEFQWSKEDICHEAALIGVSGLLAVPGFELPAAAVWTTYIAGGASAVAGVTYCW
jgi:RHS repeat-associated protein